MTSEEDYYCSLAIQAIEFIEKINFSLLKISKEEFTCYADEYEKKELLRSTHIRNQGKSI